MKSLTTSVSLLLLAVLVSGCNAESSEVAPASIRPVKLLEITDINAGSLRTFPAKVAATKQAELAFRLSGHLVEFNLVEGQQVKKAMVLARLDRRDAQNTLLNREADYELAKADFKRKGELLRRELISQAEYDLASAQLKSSKANLASAQDQLSYTELTAPYDGTVAKISIDNYQMVQANQPVLVLQKDSDIDIVIQVPESLASKVTQFNPNAVTQPVVRFANDPSVAYPVLLKEHATQVTPGTQSYEVVFTLARPSNMTVLPGMSAELTMDIAQQKSQALTAILPPSAISKRDQDGLSVVWAFDSKLGKVKQQIVTLGKVTTDGIEIVDGIEVGDKVVVAGVQYLSEGLEVKPLRWQRGV
ncbi:efflux transporter, RND family, MFP subunit [Shewanella halifaxensis HAW-EB4]|uniref:Efflux transporter, RND family, MFP subunit n=1 Tax=Shewanella halifaxensis (strain HAW-EB4) TaxID=458817 RepID=B0TVL9_SHEHH|nr:efflux RND transporter periplasmic adaptor subunit [Shewanella halifaxensis]ABZ78322.1 efflux transporter, RND family, MFP subunit [Shewanella halifaxensis HAW-EB4]